MKKPIPVLFSAFATLAAAMILLAGCEKKDTTVKNISLSAFTLDMQVGTSTKLTVTIDPENASNGAYTWSSDDATIASVDQSGNVTALKDGSTTIRVTLVDGSKAANCKVNVTDPGVLKNIAVEPTSITCGIKYQEKLTVSFTPETAKNKKVTWKSSDNSVAIVSSSGLVTAVKVGSATITATSDEGGYTATCKVTVKDAEVYYKSDAYNYHVNGNKYTNPNCPDGILHWFYSDGDHRYEGISSADDSKEGVYKDGTLWVKMDPVVGKPAGIVGDKLYFMDLPRTVKIYDKSKGTWLFNKELSDKEDVILNDITVGPDGTAYVAGKYGDKTHGNGGGVAALWTISSDQKTVTESLMHTGNTYEYIALSVAVDPSGHVWVVTYRDTGFGNGGMKLYKDGVFKRVVYTDYNGNYSHYIRFYGNDLYLITAVGPEAKSIRIYKYKNADTNSQSILYTINHPHFSLPDNLFFSKNGDLYFSARCSTEGKSFIYKNGQLLYTAEAVSSMAVVY